MKKIWLIGLIVAAMAVPFVSSAQVEVGSSAMKIGGKIKFLYASKAEDDEALEVAVEADMPHLIGDNQMYGFEEAAADLFITQSFKLEIYCKSGNNFFYNIAYQAINCYKNNNSSNFLATRTDRNSVKMIMRFL